MRAYRLLLPTVALVLAACVGGPPPEPPAPVFDPAGTWSTSANFQGQTTNGTMELSGSDEEGWTGSLNGEMGRFAMTGIRFEGTTLTFRIPDVGASGTLEFDGDAFSGEVSTEMGMIPISGTRR